MGSRILLVGLNYAPEHTGIAPYTAGMAHALRQEGWDARVITGLPHYPSWDVHPSYPLLGDGLEYLQGVPVRRVPHPVPDDAGQLSRTVMELVFGFRAALAPWGSPDAVVLVTPALFSSILVRARAALTGVPVIAWVQDIYTAGLVETGAGGSLTVNIMRRIEGKFLRSCTQVVVIHDRFAGYLSKHLGVPPERISTVRNWTHITPARDADVASLRRRFGWDPQEIVVLHTGNMGAKQDLTNVAAAAAEAHRMGAPVRFVLVGSGNQRPVLEKLAATTPRFELLRSVDDATYAGLLQAADVLLVNERPGLKEMCVPSKLTSYFTADRPVLAAVEEESPSAAELAAAGVGIRVAPGDPSALVAGALEVHKKWTTQEIAHGGGPRYVREVLGQAAALKNFSAVLRKLPRFRRRSPATVSVLART